MRRLPTAALAIACVSGAATAAVTSRDTVFTTVCIDQQATAFAWQAGKWALIPFFPNKYTMQKRNPTSPGCASMLEQKTDLSTTFDNITYGCYTIQDFGKDTSPPIACVEWWATADSTATLESVTCAGDAPFEWIIFDPAGSFQYAQLDADLADVPVAGTKDPLVLSVGRCTISDRK